MKTENRSSSKKAEESGQNLTACLDLPDIYRFLVEHSNEISYVKNAEGLFTYISPQVEQYGFKREDFISGSFLNIIDPDDRKRVAEDFQKSISSGEEFPTVFRVRNPQGKVYWLEDRGHVLRDKSGKIIGLAGIIRDITVRKLLEKERERAEALQQQAEEHSLLKVLMDNIPDLIYFKDLESRFIKINKALAERFKLLNPDEALGKTDHDFFTAEHANQAYADEQKIMRSGQPIVNKEEKETWPDGSETWVLTTKMPLFDDNDRIVGTCGISRDITVQRKTEQKLRNAYTQLSDTLTRLKRMQQQIIQHERMGALGQMASGIAHGFNNALMPILGFSEHLIKNPDILDDREDALSMIKDIHTAAQNATHAVRKLREFYRPADMAEFVPVNLNRIIEAAITFTQPKWKEEDRAKGLTIKIEKDLGEILPVLGDESQLHEVIVNLIMNSVDAMPAGGTISVRSGMTGQLVSVEMSDTGEGMSEDVQRRCFEPFFSTKAAHGGTGLGLAIAHGVMRQHGGTIDIRSKVGEGTTVTLLLPQHLAGLKQKEAEPAVAKILRPLHILVIDDEPWSSDLVKRILTRENHTVETAGTGMEGLARFKNGKFDLVITDRAMPDMSGDRVATEIKKASPKTPVILLTGFGDIMKTGGESPPGVDAIIGKPLEMRELKQTIAQVMTR